MTDIHHTEMVSCRSTARNSSKRMSGLQISLTYELLRLGCDVGGLSQAPSKTQVNHWTEEALQVILLYRNQSTTISEASYNHRREASKSWRWTIRAHKVTIRAYPSYRFREKRLIGRNTFLITPVFNTRRRVLRWEWWWLYHKCIKSDDIYNPFNTISALDRQTDRQTEWQTDRNAESLSRV